MITSTSALSNVPPSVTASAAPTINPPSSAASVRNATSSVPGASLTLKRNLHSVFNGTFLSIPLASSIDITAIS